MNCSGEHDWIQANMPGFVECANCGETHEKPPKTDSEHAKAVKDAVSLLNEAAKAAARVGLRCEVDARTVSSTFVSGITSVPVWYVSATVARPL